MNKLIFLFHKTWNVLVGPDGALKANQDEAPYDTLAYLVIWSLWLAILTAITNLVSFPCNLLNSSTNPQLFAYQDIAPALEHATGIPLCFWMAPLVWVLVILFVPIVNVFYHLIYKLAHWESPWYPPDIGVRRERLAVKLAT